MNCMAKKKLEVASLHAQEMSQKRSGKIKEPEVREVLRNTVSSGRDRGNYSHGLTAVVVVYLIPARRSSQLAF